MELTIQRNTLLGGVQKTLGIVEKRVILPILNNVLIRTKEKQIHPDVGKVTIIATDREISLVADYDAEIIIEGDITLSARKLYEMIREIQGDVIHLKKDEHNIVTITSGKVVYKIPGVPIDDFPCVGDELDVALFMIERNLLYEFISKTFFAISTDEMKRNFNGVFFEVTPETSLKHKESPPGKGEDGNLYIARMVATDGFRLAVATSSPFTIDCPPLMAKGVIIPRKGVVEIKRLLESEIDSVMVGVHKGMFILKTSNAILKVALVDDEYPDYRKVVSVDKEGEVSPDTGGRVCFNKDTMLRALRRMNVVSSEGYDGVVIKLKKDMMALNSSNPDVGDAKEEVEVSYEGEEVEVLYNVGFLIDAIDVIDGDKVTFDIGVGVKPGIIREASRNNYMCAVMPLSF
ncbi:MAG: DNA polymerase III subunit beta [Syntrophales bacterium]